MEGSQIPHPRIGSNGRVSDPPLRQQNSIRCNLLLLYIIFIYFKIASLRYEIAGLIDSFDSYGHFHLTPPTTGGLLLSRLLTRPHMANAFTGYFSLFVSYHCLLLMIEIFVEAIVKHCRFSYIYKYLITWITLICTNRLDDSRLLVFLMTRIDMLRFVIITFCTRSFL
uniref:Uncharacterized protein n=1 Tax=Manihot esculenta TaxID=3983 RepID=A0A2C9WPU8_MANES